MGALALPVKSAITLESKMADVRKVVDGLDTPDAFKAMTEQVRALSTELPMSADGIAEIVAAGGQAGIARDELMQFATDAVKMGVAFDTTAEESGQMMAQWRTAFNMTQDEVAGLADKINYLGNTGPANAKKISDIVTRIGPLGGVAGVASGEIAAMGATIAGMGVESEIAATGIKNFMLSLTAGNSATKSQKQALRFLRIKRLYGNASDLVTMIKTLSGVSLGSDLQPRGVWKTDSKTTATATQQRNVVASTLRTTAISEAAYAVTRLPAPTTSAVMQNAAVGQATTAAQSTGWPSVTHPALNNAPAVKNTVDLPTWEELTDIRDTLNTAIDKELSRTTSDALFLALRRVKADLNADINTRLEQSARIIQRTPDEVLPALVLAATWFDNAARDADIIRRNAITHPGFVPVIPLKVPVQ
ncbi:phage tail tape measure protein [Escherichia coli]|nr:phage tail tape measure protein [Escherichia coli]